MNDGEYRRLLSEVYFNRAIIWLAVSYAALPDYPKTSALFLVAVVSNLYRSYKWWSR